MSLTELIFNLKMQLARRGSCSINSLGRCFRINDRNNNNRIERDEFELVLERCKIFLARQEIGRLFRHFDRDNSGSIDYNEFLAGLVSPLEGRRLAVVRACFDKFDTDGSGVVTYDDLKDNYCASRHPKVLSGEKTEEQVVEEWLNNFDGFAGNNDGEITWEEFQDRCSEVSSNFPYSDDYFCAMMCKAYDVEENYEAKVSDDTFAVFQEQIKEKIAEKSKGSDRATAVKLFQFFDLDDSGRVNKSEFKHALERLGITMNANDLDGVFTRVDASQSGMLSYKEFVSTLYGSNRVHDEEKRNMTL